MTKPDYKDDDPKTQFKYEPKPHGYARERQSAPGAGSGRHVVRIARADRRLADPNPEVQARRITGRYQNAGAAGDADDAPFLLHVNQAGKHIEALLVDMSKAGEPARFHRFGGDLRGDDSFVLWDADGNSGTLKLAQRELLLDFDAVPLKAERFKLREARPTFLDESLEALIEISDKAGGDDRAGKTLEETERTPLTDAQMKLIGEALAQSRIGPYVAKYHENTSSSRSADKAFSVFAADELDTYVGELFADRRWPRQLEAAREYARRTLAFQKMTIGHSLKSMLQWLEDMTAEATGVIPTIGLSPEKRPLANLRKLLGLGQGGDLRRATYRLELNLKHKGVKAWGKGRVGVYYGTLEVQSKVQSFRGMKHQYNVLLVGGGLTLAKGGGEADIKASATLSTLGEWTPADFPGSLKLFEGGVWLGKKVMGKEVGKGARDAAIVFAGRGNHSPVIATLEGMGGYRSGFEAEFIASVGRVLQKGEDLERVDFSRPGKRVEYTARKRDAEDVHFDLGSALVKGLGRHAVRRCAATWLPWLASDQSALEIVGQADTVDRPERNQELSEMRARNVRQALADVLGNELGIADDHIDIRGIGDKEATKVDPDETPNRRFRRVDVNLNGRCVLVLWSS